MLKKIKSDYMDRMVQAASFCAAGAERNRLYDIFIKNSDGSIHKWHHYFQIYHRHFSKYVGRKANILEIGVFRGGSLKMWKKYFGRKATIYGLDIDPAAMRYADPKNGIHVFIGDQSDRAFMRDLMEKLPKIDIVIDDGGHTTKQQINTFLECYGKMADDGVYCCEDLHTNYWPDWIDSSETFIDFAKRHIDYLNYWFWDNNVMYSEPKAKVPEFTRVTHSICFYNSIIVFEKQRVSEPHSECR